MPPGGRRSGRIKGQTRPRCVGLLRTRKHDRDWRLSAEAKDVVDHADRRIVIEQCRFRR